MTKTSLIHSKKAYLTTYNANKQYQMVVGENLIVIEKLKLISEAILELSLLGQFQLALVMKRDPSIVHELLARGYIIKIYEPELTVVSWSN
jgi:hypothetical protein